MSSSPTTKAAEKEHKNSKEDKFSPFLGSIGWKKEWGTNRSEIVRMDKLSKLTNKVVFGLKKRITKPPISQTKADLWGILKALAPPDNFSIQVDKLFLQKASG